MEYKNPFKTSKLSEEDSLKAKDWGKVKFVPKVPKHAKKEKVFANPATPWKHFKNDLIEKTREENDSNSIDMNSAEAQKMLEKREQNYRRMLIKENSKQPTTWESFEDDAAKPSSSSYPKQKKHKLFKGVDLDNFDAKKLNFHQSNTIRKMLTKGITQKDGSLEMSVLALRRKELKKNKNQQ